MTNKMREIIDKIKKEAIEAVNKRDNGNYKQPPEKIIIEIPVSFNEYELTVTLPDMESSGDA